MLMTLDPLAQIITINPMQTEQLTQFLSQQIKNDFAFAYPNEILSPQEQQEELAYLLPFYLEALSGYHMGDCTAHPMTCLKCEALGALGLRVDFNKSLGNHLHALFNREPIDPKPTLWGSLYQTFFPSLLTLAKATPQYAYFKAYYGHSLDQALGALDSCAPKPWPRPLMGSRHRAAWDYLMRLYKDNHPLFYTFLTTLGDHYAIDL